MGACGFVWKHLVLPHIRQCHIEKLSNSPPDSPFLAVSLKVSKMQYPEDSLNLFKWEVV